MTVVAFSQVALLGLLALLVARIIALYRQATVRPLLANMPDTPRPKAAPSPFRAKPAQPEVSMSSRQFAKADWMAKAQIFAGIQMLDAKRRGLRFNEKQGKDTGERLAAAYLIGAARAITFEMKGGEAEAQHVSAFLLTHNLSLKSGTLDRIREELTEDDAALASFRCGLEGAEIWLERKFVPDERSLFSAVSSNAFI